MNSIDSTIAMLGISVYGSEMLLLGTVTMVAAGWWCQLCRYPQFHLCSECDFPSFHRRHTFQISLVVIPGMILQTVGAILLMRASVSDFLKAANVICLAASLLPTFLVSAPIHGRLSRGKDDSLIARLIRTNLPRTIAWTAHFVIAVAWQITVLV